MAVRLFLIVVTHLQETVMRTVLIAAAIGLAIASAAAFGQTHQGHGNQHGAASAPKGDRGKSSIAFHAANQKMHEGMNIAYTGNADVDFVNGMIAHHQGAIDMAKVVLTFGKDPEIRKLAEE